MKFEFSAQNFDRYSNIKFHEKFFPVEAELSHAEGGTDGQTDRQRDEDDSHFSQFCERV
jgi:hypothetical protein